jgi:hypothetical protein
MSQKTKKGFYEILWLMCKKENLLTKWASEGYLKKSKNTYYWTSEIYNEFNSVSVGELKIEDVKLDLSEHSLELPANHPSKIFKSKTAKEKEKEESFIQNSSNQLEEFISLFSRQNIGIAGKTTPKITVVKKLIKFFADYPDYTMTDVIEATKLYIANLKKQGSIRFIRECGYFISKKIDGVDQSDLVKWCEEYKQGGQNYTDYSSHNLL